MLHSDLAFLPEKMKINKRIKLVCTTQNKENYVGHIRALKQALNHGLKLTKLHRIIQFDQEAWLKLYIDMNTDLRKDAKNDFEKDFFKLMNNSVFGKTMENVRNHRDIKLVTSDKRRSILASEPNYHSSKRISKDLMIMEMKKVEVKMNKPIYLGQAILDISKTLMYEFWYDYIKPKYGDKARLCYMDTDSFVIYIKTEDFYKDIACDVERRFDTSNYDEKDERPLPTGKNKKVIGLFKDELGGKVMIEFCALRAKAYAYRLDDDTEKKKAKGTKKCIVKREITFKNYMDSLFNDEVIIRSQQRFRSDHHKVCTEEVNKIALSSNDDKRIQTFDKVTTFPYGTNVFKVCEDEMLLKNKLNEPDEDIDIVNTIIEDIDIGIDAGNTMTEDTDNTKTEDIDNIKTKDTDNTKTEDKDKTKTEDKDILDKINNKIDTINKMNKRLEKVKAEVTKKIELIYESMCELQDEIYSDDSWLRLVELEKIDAIIDETLNVVRNVICGKNRINPEKIKIDKHKDIDGYVSKLTDVINNKIELVNRMCESIDHVISEIKNETNMIDEKIHKVSEMDNDTLHLINDKLNEIITQSRKKLSKIVVQQI